jgi:hypothetical protein
MDKAIVGVAFLIEQMRHFLYYTISDSEYCAIPWEREEKETMCSWGIQNRGPRVSQ